MLSGMELLSYGSTGLCTFIIWYICFGFLSMGICKIYLLHRGITSKDALISHYKKSGFLTVVAGMCGVMVLWRYGIEFAWKANGVLFVASCGLAFGLAVVIAVMQRILSRKE